MRHRIIAIILCMLIFMVSIVPLSAQETTVCEEGSRLIVHTLGETCVPDVVERVVVIEISLTEAVVTLGVQPVGVAEVELYKSMVTIPYELSDDAVDVGSRREPNLEIITGLDPDLIIGADFRIGGIYDQLSAIAPTIGLPGSVDIEIMSQYFRTIAFALNREEEAERILSDMHQYFADAAEAVTQADVTDGFVLAQTWYADDVAIFRLFTDNAMAVEIMNLIGFENDWNAEPDPNGYSVVDIEALGAIGETNFFYVTDEESVPFYNESALWNSLPFVANSTSYRLNDDLWLYGGPLSAQRFVDQILTALNIEVVSTEGEAVAVECEAGFRLFTHEYLGSDPVCIPENLERIAVLDLPTLEVALIQGFEPVATYMYGRNLIARSNPHLNIDIMGLTAETADIGNAGTPNLEALLASNPDLIVASASTATNLGGIETLQEIAPIVLFDYPLDVPEYRASVDFMANVLNAPELADEINAQLDERLTVFKELLGDNAPEISLVRQRDAIVVFVSGSFGDHIVKEAGFVRPEHQQPYDIDYVINENNGFVGFDVSMEQLTLVDAEYIFIWTASPLAEIEEQAREIIETIEADPIWNTLEGVANKQLFIVGSHWQGFGIFEAHAALDDLFLNVLGVDPQEVAPNPFFSNAE